MRENRKRIKERENEEESGFQGENLNIEWLIWKLKSAGYFSGAGKF